MLIHKSVYVRQEVWRKLRLNSELSGVPLRDYLTYLIERSVPASSCDPEARRELDHIAELNRAASDSTDGESRARSRVI